MIKKSRLILLPGLLLFTLLFGCGGGGSSGDTASSHDTSGSSNTGNDTDTDTDTGNNTDTDNNNGDDHSGNTADALQFDTGSYLSKTIMVDGNPVSYREYADISYVQNPVDRYYQRLNVSVPELLVNDQAAPIFFPNQIGNHLPATPLVLSETHDYSISIDNDQANTVAVALSRGYVVVSAGARGSTSTVQGAATGKAPAAIVDLKAAVRYLRYNDASMPGSAEKIIANGTSAGGAYSALLGTSGNEPLYAPYLNQLGAANQPDHIFAAIAFCPITDLEHADMAYEWLYHRVINDLRSNGGYVYNLSSTQRQISAELRSLYPAYLNSLGLIRVDNGELLSDTNMQDYIEFFVLASAQQQLDNRVNLSDQTWLSRRFGRVTRMDFDGFISYVRRVPLIKDPPAFDWLGDLSNQPPRSDGSRENLLFGSTDTPVSLFTDYAAGRLGTTLSDSLRERVFLMNPMNFIGKAGVTPARHWYIRHGTLDNDTAFMVPINLYTRLMNAGNVDNVDFALAWEQDHRGDYNLEALFSWMDAVSTQAVMHGTP